MAIFKQLTTIPAALGLILAGGAIAGTASLAAAQSSSTTTSISQTAPANMPKFEPTKGGHTMNGKTETLLTGDQVSRVTRAALAANRGATIQRVETDADGDAYEAHIVKSDGTQATVKFDGNFVVTSTETRGPGVHAPRGQAGDTDQ